MTVALCLLPVALLACVLLRVALDVAEVIEEKRLLREADKHPPEARARLYLWFALERLKRRK
jgi:hypothetical protein